jgi:hypothetical protein
MVTGVPRAEEAPVWVLELSAIFSLRRPVTNGGRSSNAGTHLTCRH